MASGFRKLTERPLYTGSFFKVVNATFEGPDGEHFEREVVRHPGAVVVVPLLDDRTAVVVRQYRAALDQELLELPAGKRDVDGEQPEVTAARELQEEAGYRAGRLDLVARFYNSAGFSDELSWVYVGRDLQAVDNDLQGIEEQHLTVEELSLANVPELVATGKLIDAKTIIGLLLAAQAVAADG